jgi:hypothetical protein
MARIGNIKISAGSGNVASQKEELVCESISSMISERTNRANKDDFTMNDFGMRWFF